MGGVMNPSGIANEVRDLEVQVVHLGRRIAQLLATDAETFISKEARSRFIDAGDFADRLDDAALEALKLDAKAAASEAAASVRAALADEGIWLSSAPPEAADAPVTAIPDVAAAVESVRVVLVRYLDASGFPDGAPVEFRLPARFIDGEHLGSLTRNLWRLRRRRDQLRASIDADRKAGDTSSRGRRWDDA